jgi:hypothetical protein
VNQSRLYRRSVVLIWVGMGFAIISGFLGAADLGGTFTGTGADVGVLVAIVLAISCVALGAVGMVAAIRRA